MTYDKDIKNIKRLAAKRDTPYLEMTRHGKAVVFLYLEGTKMKGYSYANMEKAIPAELKRLAA
jgi:hypothetical protein